MTQPTTPQEAIESAALGPKQVSVDGQTVTEHNIKDLIAADQYLAAKRAAANSRPHFGLRFTKLIPPGGG